MKSTGLIIEKYAGTILGILAAVFFYFFVKPQWHFYKDIVREFPTIGMTTFGFLLTFIGIILQGGSKTIEYMKSRKILYERFLGYNKRTIILALITTIYSYIIGYASFAFLQIDPCVRENLKILAISLFCGMLLKFLIDTFIFIRLFFILIKQ